MYVIGKLEINILLSYNMKTILTLPSIYLLIISSFNYVVTGIISEFPWENWWSFWQDRLRPGIVQWLPQNAMWAFSNISYMYIYGYLHYLTFFVYRVKQTTRATIQNWPPAPKSALLGTVRELKQFSWKYEIGEITHGMEFISLALLFLRLVPWVVCLNPQYVIKLNNMLKYVYVL